MALKLITAPTLEPVSLAELKAFLRIDSGSAEPPPGVITAALKSTPAAGNVEAGVHRYRATFITADGETDGGAISAAVTVADKAINGQISLTGIPIGGVGVTQRKIYRTAAGGSSYLYLATLSNNTATTYTDNTADASLGAECPSVNTTGDPLLNAFISAARAEAETRTSRQLITATWELYLDRFSTHPQHKVPGPNQGLYQQWPYGYMPDHEYLGHHHVGGGQVLKIPLPPLQSITSITYLDSAGVSQILAPTAYRVDAVSSPGRVTPAYGTSWPDTYPVSNAVVIRFVAGYGDAAANVPQKIRQWIMAMVGSMNENRETVMISPSTLTLVQLGFLDGLLDDFQYTL